ncbi:hypothetical protein L6164_027577 [Bauhinia variegata]|uniref:Uncharacterized protein n=1 Tax=Bauhinia variegata TaxID=167791 RepID=A0ACB9LTY1_BAUVA|nr:hypothetical protein L6164_027577 [Bauhinia variegata]
MGRTMEWAAREGHLGGISRELVFTVVATLMNSTYVHNAERLIRLVRSRPPGATLITVSNHVSTLAHQIPFTLHCSQVFQNFFFESPLSFRLALAICSIKWLEVPIATSLNSRSLQPYSFPSSDAKLSRWVLAAEDICFKNAAYSFFFWAWKMHTYYKGWWNLSRAHE